MPYLDLLLRQLIDVNYATKGSELTWIELDNNFKLIGDSINALSISDVSAFEEYDPMIEYQGGQTYYVSYGGNIWKFTSPIPRTGITPGTDDTIWELASTGVLAHERNKDEYLAQGTSDEVSANEIRTFIDATPPYPDLTNYYTKTETYSSVEVNDLLDAIFSLSVIQKEYYNPLLITDGAECLWSFPNELSDKFAHIQLVDQSNNGVVIIGSAKITDSTISYKFTSATNLPANTYRCSVQGIQKTPPIPSEGFTYTFPFILS